MTELSGLVAQSSNGRVQTLVFPDGSGYEGLIAPRQHASVTSLNL